MKLHYMTGDDVRATLYVDSDPARLVTVRCNKADKVARGIAQRVNLFDGMVAALEVFSSRELGQLIVDAVVALDEKDPRHDEVRRRMDALVNAVDVILKGVELTIENRR